MSDTGNSRVDPTESVRTLTSAPFKERNLTLREHQDTDRHYIGDALPMPSLVQMQGSSNFPSVGVLPFPARVDHSHELKMTYGFFNSGYKNIPPGSVFINNLSYTGWGRNMLASPQVLAFPFQGVYFLQANFLVSRSTAGQFVNECNILFCYNNGSNNKQVLRQSNFDLPNTLGFTVTDVFVTNTAPSSNDNIQIAIQHNDSSNWDVALNQFFVFRLCGITSN